MIIRLFLCVALAGASYLSVAQGKSSVPDDMRALQLPGLSGRVNVFYSPCCKTRAIEVQSALAGSLEFYKRHLGIDLDIDAAVLNRNDWNRSMELAKAHAPYGMTHVRGGVAMIPADDGGVITQSLLADKAHQTVKSRALLASIGIDFNQAAGRFILHPALHELGHLMAASSGIEVPRDGDLAWVNEMIASYFAYAFEREQRPDLAIIVASVAQMSSDHPLYMALPDFPKAAALVQSGNSSNFIWYQHQLESHIVDVYEKEGLGFLAELKAAFPAGSAGKLTFEEAISRLDKISPGFKTWATSLQNLNADGDKNGPTKALSYILTEQ